MNEQPQEARLLGGSSRDDRPEQAPPTTRRWSPTRPPVVDAEATAPRPDPSEEVIWRCLEWLGEQPEEEASAPSAPGVRPGMDAVAWDAMEPSPELLSAAGIGWDAPVPRLDVVPVGHLYAGTDRDLPNPDTRREDDSLDDPFFWPQPGFEPDTPSTAVRSRLAIDRAIAAGRPRFKWSGAVAVAAALLIGLSLSLGSHTGAPSVPTDDAGSVDKAAPARRAPARPPHRPTLESPFEEPGALRYTQLTLPGTLR